MTKRTDCVCIYEW